MAIKLKIQEIKNKLESLNDNKTIFISAKHVQRKSKKVWILNLECICGEKFETEYHTFLKSKVKTCGACTKAPNSRKLSYEEVKQKIHNFGLNLLSENYINNSKSLRLSCENGHVFYKSLSSLQSKPYCVECKKNTDFHRKLKELYNGKFICLESVSAYTNRYKFKHVECGKEFTSTARNILDNGKCPHCESKSPRYNTDFFKEKLKDKFSDEFILIGEYNTNYVTLFHKTCGHYITLNPSTIISKNNGSICNFCNSSSIKSHYEFLEEVYNLTQHDYTVLGVYENNHKKIKIRHNTCMHEWDITPAHFLSGDRCPKCRVMSKGELIIYDYLKENNLDFETQYAFNDLYYKRKLPFDFVIFKDNIIDFIIEFNGKQHYEPVNFNGISDKMANKLYKDTIKRDAIKYQYCKDNNIKLIYIKYDQVENIHEILNNLKI